MALRTLVFSLTLLCYSSQLSRIMVEGRYNVQLSSKNEEEIEKELKLLNKPALKTIITKEGDVYDCVDFYKQPAFDHPLLKDHKYDHHQKGPNSLPTQKKANRMSQPSNLRLPGEGCPIGTVPIRRTTKEDLIRAKLFKEANDNDMTYRAVAQTKDIPNKKYNGGKTSIAIYNVSVSGSQSSSALMSLGNGPDSIEVGWTVNPSLFGDSRTRLYIYFTTASSSCYNTLCPGFVIVSTQIGFGATFKNATTRGSKDIYLVEYFIYREEVSGRWWVQVGKDTIGYWPPAIFSGMKDLASYVEWGGKANTSPGMGGPNMGSGEFPTSDLSLDAVCCQASTLNEANEIEDAKETQVFNENSDYYRAVDLGRYDDPLFRVMGFGGRGPK